MDTDNVYRRIDFFYQRRKELNKILRQQRMERYFRELAWQGKSDLLLRRIFGIVSAMLKYMLRHRLYDFSLLTRYDYVEIFYLYASVRPKLRRIEKNVDMFLDCLEQFLKSIVPDDAETANALSEGRELFYETGSFAMPERQDYDPFCDTLEHAEEIGEDALIHLNEILDTLIADMVRFFQQKECHADFARAIVLYAGPYVKPEDADENWWMSFWDYFFFDYHRKADDLSPARYYLGHEKERLSAEERYVLRDLTRAKLKIFRVNRLDEDFAVCTDLLSDETFELPCPDAAFLECKDMIFFGHIQRRGVMLLNYITGLSASKRLQRRIKDEILKQFERFRSYQIPGATMEEFLGRHAAAVRHTVQILSNFAQLRVVPDADSPPVPRKTPMAGLLEPEEARLAALAQKLGFSAYSIFYAKRLYEDYVANTNKRGTQSVLAAVLIVIEGVNGIEYAPLEKILSAFGAERSATLQAANEVGLAVNCVSLDPRYLAEEGYVQLLYLM